VTATSVAFATAIDTWRECRAAYELHLESQTLAAENSCNGNLLNRRGRAAGIDPRSLFLGPQRRAEAYPTEELLEFWRTHPRVTFAQFERQWFQ
jgi:hypothetical protein